LRAKRTELSALNASHYLEVRIHADYGGGTLNDSTVPSSDLVIGEDRGRMVGGSRSRDVFFFLFHEDRTNRFRFAFNRCVSPLGPDLRVVRRQAPSPENPGGNLAVARRTEHQMRSSPTGNVNGDLATSPFGRWRTERSRVGRNTLEIDESGGTPPVEPVGMRNESDDHRVLGMGHAPNVARSHGHGSPSTTNIRAG